MIRVRTKEEFARALLAMTVVEMEKGHSEVVQRAVTTLALSSLKDSVDDSMCSEVEELRSVVEDVFGEE